MANYNAPSGLQPVSHINGSDWNGKANRYWIPQSDVNAFYIGDLVQTLIGAGDGMLNGQIVVGIPQVTKAVANSNPRGVIVGIEPDQNGNGQRIVPATKTRGYFVLVADDPLLVLQVQANNTGVLASTCVGQFADIVVAAGSGGQGVSGSMLNVATIGLSANTFRILGLANGDFGPNAQLLVSFNWHELG